MTTLNAQKIAVAWTVLADGSQCGGLANDNEYLSVGPTQYDNFVRRRYPHGRSYSSHRLHLIFFQRTVG